MADLTTDGFVTFFAEVTDGLEPFPWQVDLVERLVTGRVPDVVDVPTGLGKTSLIHCWAYALAASTTEGPLLPRRLFFVVDRRLVVDGAYEAADDLQHRLAVEDPGPMTAAVADRLARLHADRSLPALTAVRMRGGTSWESRWLPRPDQAAVVVGTVDQFGSRLLFRGYGTSPRMRPIDAALTGTDAWLVVDEAHIAGPLVQTTTAVTSLQQLTEPVARVSGLQVTQMSATTGTGGDDVLRADLDEQATSEALPRAAAVARQRLDAAKPVTLVDLTDLSSGSRKTWRRSAAKLGTGLADLARTVDPAAQIVGVIANTIATARAAHDRLTAAGEDALLLIGRVRAHERELLLQSDAFARVRAGADRDPDARRLYVVATQTIEVGANLDLDALVTECAPLSSLVQRFGRVNRLGGRPTMRSAIVHAGFAHGDEDPVYGPATAVTWSYLIAHHGEPVTTTSRLTGWAWPEHAPLDLGPRACRGLLDGAPADAQMLAGFVPRLLDAHVERWAATSPAPMPDQEVAPFLHGAQPERPEVAVAWRATPPTIRPEVQPLPTPEDAWHRWLELAAPVEWEFVDVPIWEVRGLLAGRAPADPTSDLESSDVVVDEEPPELPGHSAPLLGVVYRSPSEPPRLVRGPADVRPGDRVVLSATVGGHDRWGWTGRRRDEDEPAVPDVADLAPTRRRQTVRLSSAVLGTLIPVGDHTRLEHLLDEVVTAVTEGDGRVAVATDLPLPDEITTALRRHARAYPTDFQETDDGRIVALLTVPFRTGSALDAVSDDDTASTSSAPVRQSLPDHGDEVGRLASTFATNLGLNGVLRRTVEVAGRWHDLGKADDQFQLMLHDGDSLGAAAAAVPVAKSGRDPRDPVARRAAQLSGLPRGFRHEAVSARLVDELVGVLGDEVGDLDVDLLHHLVVSHHGHARPLLPPVLDPDAPAVTVQVDGAEAKVDGQDQVDWGHPARFERLNAGYGAWGLALLETVVRLADIRCSEVSG